jgi:hypothetical protein
MVDIQMLIDDLQFVKDANISFAERMMEFVRTIVTYGVEYDGRVYKDLRSYLEKTDDMRAIAFTSLTYDEIVHMVGCYSVRQLMLRLLPKCSGEINTMRLGDFSVVLTYLEAQDVRWQNHIFYPNYDPDSTWLMEACYTDIRKKLIEYFDQLIDIYRLHGRR